MRSLLLGFGILGLFTSALVGQGLDAAPRGQSVFLVSTLPTASSWTGKTALVSDGLSKADCTSGGGAIYVLCVSNGSAWSSAAGGSGIPAGSTSQLQYNNAGAFAAITGATSDGTTITLADGAHLGKPAGIDGTNISNVPVGALIGLGTGVGTLLSTFSGANFATALTTPVPASVGGTGANLTPGAAGHVIRSTGAVYADSAIQAADVPTLNQNTSGRAAVATTADALTSTPTKCSAGNFPLGIAASGNAASCTPAPQLFFGTTAPGSVSGNLPGDLYSDTTNHNLYQCNATSGTVAPACTSVASGAWTLLNTAAGSVTATGVKTALSATDTASSQNNNYVACDTNNTAPVDGLLVVVKPAHDNTGAATLNWCGSGNKPIQTAYGAAMQARSIIADGAASPSGVLMRYSSAAAGAQGAWQNLTLGQVQLSSQSTINNNQYPRADGNGLTAWANPTDPGDGRRTSLIICDGRHWDIPFNSPGYGAAWQNGSATGTITGSASTGSGTQSPGCTLTSSASSGDNVYYNNSDDKIFVMGRNMAFDAKVALSATTSTRNWIGFTGGATSAIVASATPSTSGFVGFRYDTGAGDASWQCVVASASATVADSAVTPSTNQVRLKFVEDTTNNAVHFFIDGVEVCASTSTSNLPSSSTFMSFAMTETTLTTATRALTMNWAWVQGDK